MKLFTGKRRNGKTAELIKLAHKESLYILVSDKQRALAIARQAEHMGVPIFYPVTITEAMSNDFLVGRRSSNNGMPNVLIDDAEDILSYLLNVNIYGMTITSDDIWCKD